MILGTNRIEIPRKLNGNISECKQGNYVFEFQVLSLRPFYMTSSHFINTEKKNYRMQVDIAAALMNEIH